MTEQQKFIELYEKLSPEKKAVFKAMMQTVFTMIIAMTATANEQKEGGTS
jgi:hypothetical protein